jgi:hypothetical protein
MSQKLMRGGYNEIIEKRIYFLKTNCDKTLMSTKINQMNVMSAAQKRRQVEFQCESLSFFLTRSFGLSFQSSRSETI